MGAGDTMAVMLFELPPMWLVLLPLAFFLPGITNLGVYEVRWALVAYMLTGAVACVIYSPFGRWKHKKV